MLHVNWQIELNLIVLILSIVYTQRINQNLIKKTEICEDITSVNIIITVIDSEI